MGRGMNLTKLSCFQVNISSMATMEAYQVQMKNRIQDLEQIIEKNYDQRQEGDVGENSIHRSVNTKTLPNCNLVDWTSDDNVAEGRIVSCDADELVHGIPLGPDAVKVFIGAATKPEAPLWRPIPEMSTIEEVVGEMIAWNADLCIECGAIAEDIAPKSPSISSKNRCKLKALGKNDEVVAEGRWQSQDAKALEN